MSIGSVRAVSAQREAYEFVKGRILSREYLGGARLKPEEIAQQLGISRQPVREALRQLDSEGLVNLKPNRSAIVTAMTAKDIEEIYELRAQLEGLAAARAATRLTPDFKEDLELQLRRMERASADRRAWLKHHREFHRLIAQASDSTRLANEIDRMQTTVDSYVALYVATFLDPEMPGYEHHNLLAAVASGDAAQAEKVMREHVLSAGDAVMRFLQNLETEEKSE